VIDHQTIPALIQALPQVEMAQPILDLTAVSRIDSAGLAFLIDWGRQYYSTGQKILLTGASKQAQQLIDTMKLETIFETRVAQKIEAG